jgi:hypothetical protein
VRIVGGLLALYIVYKAIPKEGQATTIRRGDSTWPM